MPVLFSFKISRLYRSGYTENRREFHCLTFFSVVYISSSSSTSLHTKTLSKEKFKLEFELKWTRLHWCTEATDLNIWHANYCKRDQGYEPLLYYTYLRIYKQRTISKAEAFSVPNQYCLLAEIVVSYIPYFVNPFIWENLLLKIKAWFCFYSPLVDKDKQAPGDSYWPSICLQANGP